MVFVRRQGGKYSLGSLVMSYYCHPAKFRPLVPVKRYLDVPGSFLGLLLVHFSAVAKWRNPKEGWVEIPKMREARSFVASSNATATLSPSVVQQLQATGNR